jgi:hypothetical protein
VLLLVVCSWISGTSSYVTTFWIYRLLTIPAFAAGGVLLLKAFHQTPPRWVAATAFLGIVYLFDVKSVAFTVNGMETAFMLLFVAWAVYLMALSPSHHWLSRGLCWAGLMWTRPDGCIYIVALSTAQLVFLSKSRRATFTALTKSAAVCAILYAPWFIWTWVYYGSPVPHTIIAKTDVTKGFLGQLWATLGDYLSMLIGHSGQAFRPMYYNAAQTDWFQVETFGQILNGLTRIVGVVALLYLTYPVQDRFGRAMSLCFVILCSYFAYMPRAFPWYYPPVAMVGAVAFARAATTFAFAASRHGPINSWWPRKAFVLATFAVLAIGQMLIFESWSLIQQVGAIEAEMGTREIGKWLKENALPNENVFLEPLGYVGYFSGLRMDDFPGLVSPEVVRIRRQLPQEKRPVGADMLLVIPQLKPDWVVLRLDEWQLLRRSPLFEEFTKDYVIKQEFDISDNLKAYAYVPATSFRLFDAHFAAFHRVTPNRQ